MIGTIVYIFQSLSFADWRDNIPFFILFTVSIGFLKHAGFIFTAALPNGLERRDTGLVPSHSSFYMAMSTIKTPRGFKRDWIGCFSSSLYYSTGCFDFVFIVNLVVGGQFREVTDVLERSLLGHTQEMDLLI